jgi:hypothetical protein
MGAGAGGGGGVRLFRAVEGLVAMVRVLKINVDTLNKGGFIPRKDYDTDFVSQGLLQVTEVTKLN